MSEAMTSPAAQMLPPRFTGPTLLATMVALAIIAVAIVWRYSPWTHQYFYGDDLDYLLSVRAGSCATRLSEILTATCQERFRPVASGFVLALIDGFGAQMRYYNLVNLLIHFVSSCLVFACARRLSGGRIVVSAVLALVVATSRFALYDATQAIGPVESITLLSALACVYCVLRLDSSPLNRIRWAAGALLATLVAINTHERFVVLAAWLAVAMLSSPNVRDMSKRSLAALFLTCAALPISYIAYKTLVLDTTFLIGTGGTHLKADPAQILAFAQDAAWSIFGFNQGPAYLVGAQPDVGLNVATFFGVAFIASWLMLLALGGTHALDGSARAGIVARLDRIRWPVLLLMLATFILFPALLTIRLEHRWLLAPFTFVVLVAAWAAGHASSRMRGLALGLACMFGVSSFAIDTLVMKDYDKVYMVYSAHFASLVKRDIIDVQPDARGPVRFVAEGAHCSWTLRKGKFFGVYGNAPRPVQCFTSLEEATKDGLPPGVELYTYSSDDKLVNVTETANSMLTGSAPGQSVAFDFLSNFATGKISDTRKVDTPTGQGALVLPWDSALGRREALIILSGFSFRFDNVDVPAGSRLNVGVSMLYPAPQSARLLITATPAGSPATILLSVDLVPPAAGKSLEFQPRSIDLAGVAGQDVAFEFSVQSPGGDSTAHWVGLVKPVVVQPAANSTLQP